MLLVVLIQVVLSDIVELLRFFSFGLLATLCFLAA